MSEKRSDTGQYIIGDDYTGPERREGLPFSEYQKQQIKAIADHAIQQAVKNYPVDTIAEKAAERAAEKMTQSLYTSVGKSVITKGLWLIGLTTMAVYLWLSNHGVDIKNIGK